MKKNILVTAPLGAGGITALMLNVQKHLPEHKYHFDYLVYRNQKEVNEHRAAALGSRKLVAEEGHFKRLKPVNRLIKMYHIMQVCRREHVEMLHLNMDVSYEILNAIAAKAGGVKYIIFHSHNSKAETGKGYRFLAAVVCKWIQPFVVDSYIACSKVAAKYTFPKSVYKSGQYLLLNNGIDTEKFSYHPEVRKRLRMEMGLEDRFVIGHAGRFTAQKNHMFLLDIFAEIHKKCPQALLYLCGDGELMPQVKQKIQLLNLEDSVILAGVVQDMDVCWQLMDVMLFPSLYEGLPISCVEAQCSGLPIVASDTISKEVKLTDLVRFISLNKPVSYWADAVLEYRNSSASRRSFSRELTEQGYSIQDTAAQLERVYDRLFKSEK